MTKWKTLAIIFTLISFGALKETYRIFTSSDQDIAPNRTELIIIAVNNSRNNPSLNVSSYGETNEKAFEMMKDSINDLFSHFVNISRKELEEELVERFALIA